VLDLEHDRELPKTAMMFLDGTRSTEIREDHLHEPPRLRIQSGTVSQSLMEIL
jgi:hypothetical protein